MTHRFGAAANTDEVLPGIDLSPLTALLSSAPRATWPRLRRSPSPSADVRNGGGLDLIELDLASLKGVRAAADALVAAGEPFDVIICNAGVMARP